MFHEIIMPSLGMSQDNGVIVSWKKSIGDFVDEGEMIMEIETDKAIQSIPSPVKGYLNQIIYQENIEVPVGEVVARLGDKPDKTISTEDKENPVTLEESTTFSRVDEKTDLSVNVKKQNAIEDLSPNNSKKDEQGLNGKNKILISPKARMLAQKHGISPERVLARLKRQPLHASDIEVFLKENPSTFNLKKEYSFTVEEQKKVSHFSMIEWKVEGKCFKKYEQVLKDSNNNEKKLSSQHLMAVLALKSWREFFGERSKSLSILIKSLASDSNCEILEDADLLPFRDILPIQSTGYTPANLELINLLKTGITYFKPYILGRTTIVVRYEENNLLLSLYMTDHKKSKDIISFINRLSDYVQEPILYIF